MSPDKPRKGPNETALAIFVDQSGANTLIAEPGKAELPSVRREDISPTFLAAVDKCAAKIDAEAARNADDNEKKAKKKRDAEVRSYDRKIAWRKFWNRVSNAVAPVTTPVAEHVRASLDSGVNFVTMKYNAYARARYLKIKNHNKEQYALLYKAVEEDIIPEMKALSQIKSQSHFDLYRVYGCYQNNGYVKGYDGFSIHYVATEKQDFPDSISTNIVVMSIWDNGNIEIRGNCEAYKDFMKEEAMWFRTSASGSSDMDVMWWDNACRELTIKTTDDDKSSYYDRYIGFDKNAVNETAGRMQINRSVIENAKNMFSKMVISQGLYSPPANV